MVAKHSKKLSEHMKSAMNGFCSSFIASGCLLLDIRYFCSAISEVQWSWFNADKIFCLN